MAANAAKGKAQAADMTTAATGAMAAAVDHDQTGDMADTATGEVAVAPPGAMEGAMADGAPAPGCHLRPTHETAVVLSHR